MSRGLGGPTVSLLSSYSLIQGGDAIEKKLKEYWERRNSEREVAKREKRGLESKRFYDKHRQRQIRAGVWNPPKKQATEGRLRAMSAAWYRRRRYDEEQ